MGNTLLTIFIVVTALAVVMQACILLSMALAASKTQTRVLEILEEMRGNLNPIMRTTRELLDDSAPKIKSITTNLEETSQLVRVQTIHLNRTMDDLLERTHRHVERVDAMVDDTLDTVDEARTAATRIAERPLRWATAVTNGIWAAIDRYINRGQPPQQGFGVAHGAMDEEEIFD
jgi:methyl-accepting chemotaxis protein